MPNYNSNLHKVTINTWRTKNNSSNGLGNYLEQGLFGENIGHASIEMTLPISKETEQWIEAYCMEQTFQQYKETLSSNKQENLTFEYYINNAKKRIPFQRINNNARFLRKKDEEENSFSYYKIDFSYWPADDNGRFSLSNKEEDMMYQRKGRPFEYSPDAKKSIQPEETIRIGFFGAKHMTYAPLAIVHQRDMSDEQFAQIKAEIELKRMESQLKILTIIEPRINALKESKIEKRFAVVLKNMGIFPDLLIQDFYAEEAKFEKAPENDINERFNNYLLKQAKEQVAKAKSTLDTFKNTSRVVDSTQYITYGISPDHSVELPYVTESGRGLNPEAMLRKMRELTEPKTVAFDLVLKNCSKTVTAVLGAGTEHDPLLHLVTTKEALGCIGTPQQVLVNVRNARDVIVRNEKDTFITRVLNIDPINHVLGKFISRSMEEETTMGQQILIALGILGLAILKMPMAIFQVILNPSESISNILDLTQNIFKHSASVPLKTVIGVLSAAFLVALIPFALVEKTLLKMVALFTAHQTYNQKSSSPVSCTPDANNSTIGYKAIEELIKSKTHTISMDQSHALNLLTQFEMDLESKPDKVVTLSVENLDTLNQYIREQEDVKLKQRFHKCCASSLARANQLSKSQNLTAEVFPHEINREARI